MSDTGPSMPHCITRPSCKANSHWPGYFKPGLSCAISIAPLFDLCMTSGLCVEYAEPVSAGNLPVHFH